MYSKRLLYGNSKRSVFNDGREDSKEGIRQLLITRPICRIYYEANHSYGYYKQYKYVLHEQVWTE